MTRPFYGKYRGVVTDTNDPLKIGRVRARVPDVTGNQESGWALPCAPFGGGGAGLFALPKQGAGVWIEFEHGDPDYPIWAGCWFGSSDEVPSIVAAQPDKRVAIKTPAGHSLVFDDSDGGGITLEASGGQKIVIGANGIEINDGKGGTIKIDSSKVSVNNDALEVM